MKIHNLPGDPGRQQKRKRVGRGHGSGHGKTSTKGHKGQQSRSGGHTKPGFEGGQMPLQRRLPKFGFKNPFRVEYEVVNLSSLEKAFDEGATVDPEALKKARLVKSSRKPIKVLANGEITKKLTVKAHKFSETAREKIAKAGGSAEVLG
jgi:large subunit ribosomal protein L15